MPNIHFMMASLPSTRGCEEPLKLGNNVEVTVVGGAELTVVDMTVEVVVIVIGEGVEELLDESGAVQNLAQILAT